MAILMANNGITTSILDKDARDFIDVAGISDQNQIRSLNELCKDLKYFGFWDKLSVVFPFIYAGTTASMFYELKTKQSSLSFGNTGASPTFSSTGVQFNGGEVIWNNSYFFVSIGGPGNVGTGHISIYRRTSNYSGYAYHGAQENFSFNTIVIGGSGSNAYGSISKNGNIIDSFTVSGTSGLFLYSNSDNNGGFTASVTNPYVMYMSRNGQVVGSASSTSSIVSLGNKLVIGGLWTPYGFSGQTTDEICWYSYGNTLQNSSIGAEINISEQGLFYNVVQKFQTALGREV